MSVVFERSILQWWKSVCSWAVLCFLLCQTPSTSQPPSLSWERERRGREHQREAFSTSGCLHFQRKSNPWRGKCQSCSVIYQLIIMCRQKGQSTSLYFSLPLCSYWILYASSGFHTIDSITSGWYGNCILPRFHWIAEVHLPSQSGFLFPSWKFELHCWWLDVQSDTTGCFHIHCSNCKCTPCSLGLKHFQCWLTCQLFLVDKFSP